jgi:hypothetical protein
MNRTVIKNFAVRARQRLLEAVRNKAAAYGITEAGTTDRQLADDERALRDQLIVQINRSGYEQVMEEDACLWFMRLITLRYLEVNGLLLQGGSNRHLTRLPMFEELPGWAQLLCPNDLTGQNSVYEQLVSDIPVQDFEDHIQIIGWLYQSYNSPLKDDTFARLKQHNKISKERIPAATQLFTPDWIVRYLVENSLGRLYVRYVLSVGAKPLSEAERAAAEQEIAGEMGWIYYVPEAEQVSGSYKQKTSPFEITRIKVLDPCVGAGHILVCAFDVLMQIYRALGWSERDAARSIIKNNLYGLDLDARVCQLSAFALMMKAAKADPECLNGAISPNVFAVLDGDFLTEEQIGFAANGDVSVAGDLFCLRSAFRNAVECGSLLEAPRLDYGALYKALNQTPAFGELVKQAQILAQEYDVVVTNPPYMSIGSMSDGLSQFVKEHYPDSKSDLFAVFLERCTRLVKEGGYQAMITQHSWMFLRSFAKLRQKLSRLDTVSLIHLGARAFADIPGDVVQTAGVILRNTQTAGYRGIYCRLTEPATQSGKEALFLSGRCRYQTAQDDFRKLPGGPIAYWLSPGLMDLFTGGETVSAVAAAKQGIATANNSRYLRLWHECGAGSIFDGCSSQEQSAGDERKWYPYNKGGGNRKWFGQPEYMICWHRDGQLLRSDEKAVIRNQNYFFQRSVSWSLVCTGIPAFRSIPAGQLFDVAGMSCFSDRYHDYLLALFNSKVAFELLKVLSPTINYQCGDIANMPLRLDHSKISTVEKLVQSNVELCREDWDSFECSRSFKKHPLIVPF